MAPWGCEGRSGCRRTERRREGERTSSGQPEKWERSDVELTRAFTLEAHFHPLLKILVHTVAGYQTSLLRKMILRMHRVLLNGGVKRGGSTSSNCFFSSTSSSSTSPGQANWSSFATVDPWTLSASNKHTVKNLVNGQWRSSEASETVIDPMNGEPFLVLPATSKQEATEFVSSLNTCPKSGLHNPIKNPERYLELGAITAKAAQRLKEPEVSDYFSRLVQRVVPKSWGQAKGSHIDYLHLNSPHAYGRT